MGYLDSSDGLQDIRCTDCGKIISRGSFVGFTTALCIDCQKGVHVVAESIPLELREVKEEESNIVEKVIQTIKKVVRRTKKEEQWTAPKSDSKINLKKKM